MTPSHGPAPVGQIALRLEPACLLGGTICSQALWSIAIPPKFGSSAEELLGFDVYAANR